MNGLRTSTARVVAVLGAVVAALGSGFVAAPAVVAASQVAPTVTSQSLQTSYTHVTSSTTHKLQVQMIVEQPAGSGPGTTVAVTLRNGSTETSEVHVWTFPVPEGALNVDDTGAGVLDVPSADTSPYATISMTVAPVGDSTTQTCQGQDVSRTQDVSLNGTFFFDTASNGSHAWGSVGSTTKSFAFSSTNLLVSQYNPSAGAGCINYDSLPCLSGVFWSDNQDANHDFEGVAAGKHGLLIASRTKTLSTPSGATRNDEAFATTNKLDLVRTSTGGASLSVKADTNSAGNARLTGKKAGKPFSHFCRLNGKKKTETSVSWSNAKYKNGTKKLAVHEEIFGSIKLADNTNGSLSTTRIS